jgi:hypothetical protein
MLAFSHRRLFPPGWSASTPSLTRSFERCVHAHRKELSCSSGCLLWPEFWLAIGNGGGVLLEGSHPGHSRSTQVEGTGTWLRLSGK